MSADILGPANAPNAVTTRPAETRTFGNNDSWYKDCTSQDIEDGTDIQAAWFNNVIAALRAIARINGNLEDGVTAVVADIGTDDLQVLKAIRQMIQRGQIIYGVDTGVANALVAALTPTLREYKAGMHIFVKPAFSNTAAATINVNGLGLKTILRADGTMLLAGDLVAGSPALLVYDGVYFRVPTATGRPPLTSNLHIYVNAGLGNDANDGTANVGGKAMATVSGAVYRAFSYSPSQYTITIHIAHGDYGPVATPQTPGPTIIVVGDDASPIDVKIGGNANAFQVTGPNVVFVSGVHVWTGNPAETVSGFVTGAGASLTTDKTSSGYVMGGVFEPYVGGNMTVGSHRFTGNSRHMFWAYQGQMFLPRTAVYTIVGSITMSGPTAFATYGGLIIVDSPTPTFVNGAGVTGQRYLATYNGLFNTQGAGANYFPGTVAGAIGTGGQYA